MDQDTICGILRGIEGIYLALFGAQDVGIRKAFRRKFSNEEKQDSKKYRTQDSANSSLIDSSSPNEGLQFARLGLPLRNRRDVDIGIQSLAGHGEGTLSSGRRH